jgi:predicted RecB family nuclease
MRLVDDQLLLAPTDLSTFVGCRHRTGLELAVAHRVLQRPVYEDPYAAILRRKGEEHERRYVELLRTRGLRVAVIVRDEGPATSASLDRQTADTLAAMHDGADVIVQARLADGALAGYADVLTRVDAPSRLGAWSYEAQDTKLARETKGGAVLQLCGYSELLAHMQGRLPTHFHVVTPDPHHPVHTFRAADYLAYYRMVRRSLQEALAEGHERLRSANYPEPVEHCDVCAWEARCLRQRRQDDHLSFIAGATRVQRQELTTQGYQTLTSAASMPTPVVFRPSRGARESYDRLGDQARVQLQQRREQRPVFESLPIVAGDGLSRLPEPSPGDVFLDLEGARFAREEGREYLFGVFTRGSYRGFWATDDGEEKRAFEEVMDLITAAWQADPGMHVYHFNHYEPIAFKKLVGRHVTRVEALNQLLRATRFVDLFPIVRQAVRCGVESYSIKQLEQYYGFERRVALTSASQPLLAVELALEAQTSDALTDEIRVAVQGYNEDDCRSTEGLRDWLEGLRAEAVGKGAQIPRPTGEASDPPETMKELQQRVEALRASLLDGLPADASDSDHPDHARWLLAYLIDWHRREDNAQWWEYFRLKEMPEDELLDESRALAGLRWVERVEVITHKKSGKPTGSVVDRYAYPIQEVELRGKLKLQDGRGFGEVKCLDREARTVDIRKGRSVADVHPSAVFAADVVPGTVAQEAVMRLGERLLSSAATEAGRELLRRQAPRLESGPYARYALEDATAFAIRIAPLLSRTTLAIQGPPGAGKTFTGARMIVELVRAGKRVGITATGHKVIVNLMEEVRAQARAAGMNLVVGRKPGDNEDPPDGPIRLFRDNASARQAIADRDVQVLGGTVWLWSRQEFADTVDVLFVDEAGQMSLANVLAVSQAADSLVLLGDPQQLEQPQKASHPDGVGISALDHVLNGAETMPENRGIFLPTTYRMSPSLTRFTSELFYAGKLQAERRLEAQALRGTGRFDGSGLWLIPVAHDGNQNAAPEEVEAVADLVASLLNPDWCLTSPPSPGETPHPATDGPRWLDLHGVAHPLTAADIKVVAPFNAQVNRLTERLSPLGVSVGTVDKFQGQTAAVVIYSLTTSRPEDAPRGMEFVYSRNRLNVATSRARCAVFVICSPRMLEPECRTPRQMQLANGLCRYAELAMS